MQFNSLFMIKVAESKGVFGDTSKEQAPAVVQEQQPSVNLAQQTASRHKRKGHKVSQYTS